MATGGLYGNSGTGALIAQPGTETPGLYGKSPNGSVVAQPGSESAGLYGNGTTFGGYYFEWFVFQTSATQPATPTGGTWNFQTDSGTAPSGWTNAPASNPTNPVWISIALVNSRSTSPLVWSTPGVLSYSGTINGSGAPTSGIGQIGELYIQTGVNPNALWFKSGSTTWTQITGSALYVDLTSSQTIAGTKTFSSTIQGNISGNAGTVTNGVYTDGSYVNPSWIASLAGSKITGNISGNAANVTGTVAIVNGGTGATTASGARTNLGLGTIATQDASSVAITGGSITGITDLAIADGGTGASTAGQARTNLGLGTAAVLDAGVANGVATLDAGGTVPLSQIPASIQGGVSYQGAWNASTNTPTLASSVGTKGYYYVVSVAGSTNLNGVTSWNIGDWAIFNGTAWEKIDNTDAVTSVNGFTGTVVLTAANVNALAIANNLSDLANAGTARTNLGLGTAATQNSTAFATAAQGATADTALQTVTSADGSIVVLQTGTNIDLAVSAASPASTLLAQVRNTTGATLTKGTVVYISGATGQISIVSKANASSDATSAQTLGMITANLANNSNGYVTVFGLLQNMDTSAYTDGAQLYLSGTVAGAVTATKPSAPIHLVYVAVVEYAHPTQGKLLVKVQNGYELDEIHDVSIVSPTTGQTLVYDSVTDLWSNSNAPTITGGTINNTTIGATTPSTGVFTTLTAQNETLKGTGTNLLVQSSSLTTTWTQSNVTLTGGQTDPFGGTTAATLNSGTAVGTQHSFFQATSYASNVFTLSIYAKAGTANYIGVYLSAPNSGVIFNLATGSVSVNIGTPPSASSITAVSGAVGWYRCSITVSGAQSFSQFFISEDGVALTFTGTSKTITVAAPQLEIGSVLNTYIPTTTTAVYGTPTLSFSGVASIGLQSDGSLYETSAGTGNVRFYTNNIGQEQARVSHTASAVNYVNLTGGATTKAVIQSAQGSDSNISYVTQSKGTGAIDLAAGSSGVNISNGGTVTAITITSQGSNYTSIPTTAIAAPTTAGGVQATFSVGMYVSTWTVTNGGTGYTVGDLITAASGGTYSTPWTLLVTAVSGGVITAVSTGTGSNAGTYTVLPSGAQSITGGTGSSATITINTWGVRSGTASITNAGSGYVEQPTVTFSGGGGSGAAAYATVGSGTVVKSVGSTMDFYTPSGIGFSIADGGITGGAYAQAFPNSTLNVLTRAAGSPANLGFYQISKGTGGHFFTTNGSTSTIQFNVSHTASAVNYVQVTGAATGGGPTISSQGSDANARLLLNSKGSSSGIDLLMNNSRQVFIGTNGSAVNYLLMGGTATGFGPRISAEGSDTNIPLVLQPKGTGALQAQQTDSTATGGNARGANAVDWQTSRSAASQVASATGSFIGSGSNNTASGWKSSVVGGNTNASTSSVGYAFIGGGTSNTASGAYSFIGSGASNAVAGYYNFVGGGFTNSGTASAAVTTQSSTMNGTTAVTLSGSNASIKVGQYITGTSIADDTYVAAVSGTSLTLSKVASGSSTSTLSFYTPHGVVVGGGNNQATGSYSFIGGGGDAGTAANRNVASGDWSTVAGGQKNQATGYGSVIVGGGGYAGVIIGNNSSGSSSFIGAGFGNNNTAFAGFLGAGYGNTVNSQYGVISGGSFGTTRSVVGYHTFPAHNNPISQSTGITQAGLLILATETTNATATVLRSDSNAAGTTNQVILPNNSAYYFKGSVIANVTGAANGAAWSIEGAIMRGANAASTVLMGTPAINRVAATAGATAWAIAITADTTNGGLAVTVTGAASTTIRWVCSVNTTETTF